MSYDVIVVGLGAAGSAALYELARRGQRVLGIEQFTPGHDRGSSHGHTRMIRQGYYEHPSYVPLVRHAYTLWRRLEDESGETLLHITGILEAGLPGSELITGTLRSSREHGLPHEIVPHSDLAKRFPAFRLPEDFTAVFQPDGGYVAVEKSLAAMIHLARRHGAEVKSGMRVSGIVPDGDGVRIETPDGPLHAGRAIVTAGAWTPKLFPDLPIALKVTREALLWADPLKPELFAEGRFPVFLIESDLGFHYGFPLHGRDGMKIAKHHHASEPADPDDYDRDVSARDEDLIRRGVGRFLPDANGPRVGARTCLYTMTGNSHFLIDVMPDAPQIVVASPCSGHGFKFAPATGEILADLATHGKTRHAIGHFALHRAAPFTAEAASR